MRAAAFALMLCCSVVPGMAEDLETLGALAFRTGYPLVGMAGWRDSYVKVGGAMNRFSHRRDLLSVSAQEAYQNTDTLYSNTWVDLARDRSRCRCPRPEAVSSRCNSSARGPTRSHC